MTSSTQARLLPCSILSVLASALLAAPIARCAEVNVDASGLQENIGLPTTAGNRGQIQLDPDNALGWANWKGSSTVPNATDGNVPITLSQIGEFTLTSIGDCRFSDAWRTPSPPVTTDTAGVRGSTQFCPDSMMKDEGFRISLVPKKIGKYRLSVHMGDYSLKIRHKVTLQNKTVPNSSGILPDPTPNQYDEGVVHFDFTVTTAEEAAATWNFDLTCVSGQGAMFIGGATLIPQPDHSQQVSTPGKNPT